MSNVTASPARPPYTENMAEIATMMTAALWLQEIGVATVMLDFSGHYQVLEIRIYEGGWSIKKVPVTFTFHYITEPGRVKATRQEFITYIKKHKA